MRRNGMNDNTEKKDRTWVEHLEVAGSELVDHVKQLIEEGNVRRVIIRKESGEILMEIPLTGTVVGVGVVTIFAPVLVALGAMAALLARVKIEVIRTDEKGNE
jgi:hypothetical protein